MIRQVIEIDEEKCNGCGACASACQEGAIGMVNGKARLLRDDYCDGLGNCLPACPANAISFVQREAAAFDEEAVKAHMEAVENASAGEKEQSKTEKEEKAEARPHAGGCPGTRMRQMNRRAENRQEVPAGTAGVTSRLQQWPVQIKLVPIKAPYFEGADLLVAADCTAYAYGNFHNEFIRNRITLIGCPKLDEGDYTEKLTAIIANNDIKSLTIVRMEVPCCGGLQNAAVNALKNSGKFIPWQVVTISVDGTKLE